MSNLILIRLQIPSELIVLKKPFLGFFGQNISFVSCSGNDEITIDDGGHDAVIGEALLDAQPHPDQVTNPI